MAGSQAGNRSSGPRVAGPHDPRGQRDARSSGAHADAGPLPPDIAKGFGPVRRAH